MVKLSKKKHRLYRKCGGFTLIELVMVIVLLGILSTVVIIGFNATYALKLDAAANKLVSDIRYVQQLAITKQKNFGIYFQPSSEIYKAYQGTTTNIIKEPLTKNNLIVNYTTDEELSGINLDSTNFTNGKLEFNPLGEPLDGTGLVINYVGRIILTHDSSSRTIKIEKNTGMVWIE